MKEFFTDSKNIIISLLVVAIATSLFYWYACMNKGLCKIGNSSKSDKSIVLAESKTLDGKEVFENVAKIPLVVYFEASSTAPVVAQMDAELKALTKYANENGKNIYVTGHSKSMANWNEANAKALANANAVKDLLVTYGATSTKVFVSSKSSNRPVSSFNSSEEINNRAVISVDYYRQK